MGGEIKKSTLTVNNKKNNSASVGKLDYLTKIDVHIFNAIMDGIYVGSEASD